MKNTHPSKLHPNKHEPLYVARKHTKAKRGKGDKLTNHLRVLRNKALREKKAKR